MAFYRAKFPQASVLPKMHLLEMHVVPWLRRWGVGLGLMGEQGAESIHAAINSITPAFLNISDRVKRLQCILAEHHRQVCPTLTQCIPVVKKRGKYNKNNCTHLYSRGDSTVSTWKLEERSRANTMNLSSSKDALPAHPSPIVCKT